MLPRCVSVVHIRTCGLSTKYTVQGHSVVAAVRSKLLAKQVLERSCDRVEFLERSDSSMSSPQQQFQTFPTGQLHGATLDVNSSIDYTEQSPAINSLAGTTIGDLTRLLFMLLLLGGLSIEPSHRLASMITRATGPDPNRTEKYAGHLQVIERQMQNRFDGTETSPFLCPLQYNNAAGG